MPVAFSFAPVYWSLCQGQEIQVSQQQALYSLLGNTFGGTPVQTFKLPDLRGRAVVGTGPAASLPGIPPFLLGQVGGGQLESSQVPAHTHPGSLSGATAQGSVSLPVTGSYGPSNVSVSGPVQATTAQATQDVPQSGWTLGDVQPGNMTRIYANPSGATNVALADVTSSGTISGTISGTAAGDVDLPLTGSVTVGPNTPASTPPAVMAPYLALNMIIATMGIYPSRP